MVEGKNGDPLVCPIDLHDCRRKECLARRRWPECVGTVSTLVTIIRGLWEALDAVDANESTRLTMNDFIEGMVIDGMNKFGVDEGEWRSRLQDEMDRRSGLSE